MQRGKFSKLMFWRFKGVHIYGVLRLIQVLVISNFVKDVALLFHQERHIKCSIHVLSKCLLISIIVNDIFCELLMIRCLYLYILKYLAPTLRVLSLKALYVQKDLISRYD